MMTHKETLALSTADHDQHDLKMSVLEDDKVVLAVVDG